ncbi:DNA polymerase III subunit chi [Candidatus Kinetoplastibacterium desouzaii TCC079E]|uniref:DNA polymerase III subunit chi n=1 Tax=Candidatus Kinetoplastidibacterium desouzai TCC079E TaxID=1208919 RepID=M1LS85_9PROT|nr:DNA polymerase III subunit chi [Candidatus Kinetoplastibacterium desouzaii]AGF47001.1 DNA polymerase III subunit chi [Candidatus Kinetoplastibacterium desouzaii TCC079E]
MKVSFVFGVKDKLISACHIVHKNFMTNKIILIICDDNNISKLDKLLWTFNDVSFIPHNILEYEKPNKTPVILAKQSILSVEYIDKEFSDKISLVINLSNNYTPNCDKINHVIEIVSEDEKDRLEARNRWRFYKQIGYQVAGIPSKISIA